MGRTTWLCGMLACLGSLPAQQRAPTFFTIVDVAGKPLAGATVTCVHSPDLVSPWPRDVVTATSDDRGRARGELIVGRLYTAWAVGSTEAAGNTLASEPMTQVAAGRLVPVVACESAKARELSLRGHDAWREVGGKSVRWFPVAEADVHVDLAWPEGERLTLPPSPWARGCLALVDGNGELLATTRVDPEAAAPPPFVAPLACTATVLDGDGKPLVGATLTQVMARGTNAPPLFRGFGGAMSMRILGRTDAAGQLQFHASDEPPARPGGPVRNQQIVHVTAPGHEHAVQVIGAKGRLEIRMTAAAPTVVHVLGAPGDARLFAVGNSTLLNATRGTTFLPHALAVQTQSATRFLVEASPRGFLPRLTIADKVPTAVVSAFVDADATEATIDLGQARSVAVHVHDVDGGPVACAVAASRVTEGFPISWYATLASDLAGRARLLLVPDEYCVYATTGDAHGVALVAKEQKEPVEVRLQPLPTMQVRVLDADGKPVPGVQLRATGSSFGAAGRGPLEQQWDRVGMELWSAYAARSRTDADGRMRVPVFARPGLTAGVVAVRGTRTSESFQLQPGGEAEIVLGQ